jgi:importin-4
VHEGFINTKKAALTALGALAEHTKASFYPHLEESLGMLLVEGVGACYSYHGSIRSEAFTCLEQMTQVVVAQYGPHEEPLKGVSQPLNAVVNEVMKTALTTFINAMDQDAEKEPAAAAVEGVASILGRIGLVGLNIMTADSPPRRMADPLFETLTKLINEKAACQTETNFEMHEGDDDDDHDAVVMDSVSDLVGTLAKVMGVEFMPVFDSWVKPLLKFAKPNRLYTDRSMVIGCFAEVIGEFGAPAIKYADVVLPIIKVGLGDEMEPVRRNAAYAVGVFVEATGDQLGANILPMLQAIHPVCVRPAHQQGSDCGGADIDNAISAVARIILAMPSVVPLGQMLPVIVAALPLRVDFDEGACIYGMFAKLIAANEPTTMQMLPQVLTLFAEVLSSQSKANDETKQAVTASLKAMVTSAEQQPIFMGAVGSLTDPTIKPILEAAVNSA